MLQKGRAFRSGPNIKLNANDYTTSMTGLKFNVAHKRAEKDRGVRVRARNASDSSSF